MNKTRIGIVGYGNLGRGVIKALRHAPDMELVGVFTRRDPAALKLDVPCYALTDAAQYKDQIDVMILCGGSLKDIPEQAPQLIQHFNLVDSYDNHAQIASYYKTMDAAARASSKVAVISTGWDPGLFSIQRVLSEAVLPQAVTHSFWGPGVSQGHSDAIRRVEGVADGIQYTLPIESAIAAAEGGLQQEMRSGERHTRVCYVVLEEGADPARVAQEIKSMPAYFADYDTDVHFISAETLKAEHSGMAHGGLVLRSGVTGDENAATISYRLELSSNPEFTSSVNVAFARACKRLADRADYGAKTVLDIPIGLLSPRSAQNLRETMV